MPAKKFKPTNLKMLKSETDIDWKSTIKDEITHYKEVQTKFSKKNGRTVDYDSELCGALEKRRIKALSNSLTEISENHPKSVYDWILLNVTSESYALLENNDNMMMAAAIWILDQTDKHHVSSKELYELLPTSEESFNVLDFPDIWDCRFSDTLIYSVESVLRPHFFNFSSIFA